MSSTRWSCSLWFGRKGISGGFHQVHMDTPGKDTVGMDTVGKCWQNVPIRLHINIYSGHSL